MFNVSMCSSVGFSVCCGSKELLFEVSPQSPSFHTSEQCDRTIHLINHFDMCLTFYIILAIFYLCSSFSHFSISINTYFS